MDSTTENIPDRAPAVLHHEPKAVTFARESAGLSKAALARACGVSRSLIAEWEAGTRSATPEKLRKAAAAMNCPLVVLQRRREIEPVESSPYPKRNPMVTCTGCDEDNDPDSGRTYCTYCGIPLPPPWGPRAN